MINQAGVNTPLRPSQEGNQMHEQNPPPLD